MAGKEACPDDRSIAHRHGVAAWLSELHAAAGALYADIGQDANLLPGLDEPMVLMSERKGAHDSLPVRAHCVAAVYGLLVDQDRAIPFDVRVESAGGGKQIVAIKRLDTCSRNLHVLLRHRRNIPHDGTAKASNGRVSERGTPAGYLLAMLIAIDGPAGAGKSTVARALARELGFRLLDTGAMYRAVGLLALREPEREPAALASAASIELRPGLDAQGDRVLLDGDDVSEAIREPRVSQAASEVAADPGVREALVAKQQQLVADGDWVAEGRDIATVVAPWAEVKVYLTASPDERARRRAAELGIAPAAVASEQAIRDERDRTREHGPLRSAAGALELDSTALSLDQVVTQIAALAREKRADA